MSEPAGSTSNGTIYPASHLGQYVVVKDIAEGTFGTVKMGVHVITGHRVAMKYISKKMINATKTKLRVQREVEYMRMLRHPHIIKLYEVINTPTDIIIVLEYVAGELFNYIVQHGRMKEDKARKFFQQLISGIDYSHRLKVVHRDLKPENVLLDDDLNVKIADFGLSNRMMDGEFFKTSCGSPNYAAPEVIRGALYEGPEIDVWSCGVVLFVMLCGRLPFEDDDINQLFTKITSGHFLIPNHVSPDARYLLHGMLNTDPLKRLTIPDILRSPWFMKDLPGYLMPLPPPPGPLLGTLSSLVEPKKPPFEIIPGLGRIDDTVIDGLVGRLQGVDRAEILEALRRDDGPTGNAVKVAYALLRDMQRQGRDVAEFEQEEREAYLVAMDPKHNLSPVLSPGGDPTVNPFDTEFGAEDDASGEEEYDDDIGAVFEEPEHHITVLPTSLPQIDESIPQKVSSRSRGGHRRPHRPRWHFGIRSRSPPMEVMLEIYRVLKLHGAEWREKRVLGGLGGIPDPDYIRRAREEANPDIVYDEGYVDMKAATSVYLIEARVRVEDVVVLMNIQLYMLDEANYLVDFQHKGYYQAAKRGPTFDMERPAPIEYLEPNATPQSEHAVTSPFLFMDVACKLIIELAGGA
ncbi:Pkinase-domain-containing protein [Auricularia subglabra TFB-10046 SS5]|nr:Pkinase-domain-containing protein [Auricularia subglabra TFB-10046 SS5]